MKKEDYIEEIIYILGKLRKDKSSKMYREIQVIKANLFKMNKESISNLYYCLCKII
jgi:hypothetical protein